MTEKLLDWDVKHQKLNMQVQLSSGARSLNFSLSFYLHPYFVFGPCREKTCLRVSDKVSFKPVSSASETS